MADLRKVMDSVRELERRFDSVRARRADAQPSSAWRSVIENPDSKSFEIASANAKELYRIRNLIDKLEREPNATRKFDKIAELQTLYKEVETRGRSVHENMPVHGVMLNTSRAR